MAKAKGKARSAAGDAGTLAESESGEPVGEARATDDVVAAPIDAPAAVNDDDDALGLPGGDDDGEDDDDHGGDDDDDDDDDGEDLGPLLLGEAGRLPADWGPAPAGHRSGVVTLVGRPNAGKSTLLNAMLGEKLAITSPKPQTTRDLIRGYLTRPDMQAVLVDTPGIHMAKKGALLNRAMVGVAIEAMDAVDVALLVIDAKKTMDVLRNMPLTRDAKGVVQTPTAEQAMQLCHRGDRAIVERLQRYGHKIVVVLNKRDLVRPGEVLPLVAVYGSLPGVIAVVPVCARRAEGLDTLLEVVAPALPEGPLLVDPELLTDRSERFLCGELLREALFMALQEELPYQVAVVVERFDESGDPIHILATVCVERSTQKGIVLGKGGLRMREIATRARAEMEAMLQRRVYLEVYVKVEAEWTSRLDALRRLGYGEGAEVAGSFGAGVADESDWGEG